MVMRPYKWRFKGKYYVRPKLIDNKVSKLSLRKPEAAKREHQTYEALRSRFRARFPAEVGFRGRVGVDGVWDFAPLLRR